MDKPRLLDLFCGAGGCAKGYQRAGFYVIGVDHKPQKNYCGDEFRLIDALEYLRIQGKVYDAIHASPPCQAYSVMSNARQNSHPKLIEQTRQLLKESGKPYVIENVIGAPLENPIMLCGNMFGLRVYRHRLFESNVFMLMPPHVSHKDKMPKAGTRGIKAISPKGYICVVGNFSNIAYAKEAMGIAWMNRNELAQAIPPAYTQWIGERLLEFLEGESNNALSNP